MGKLCLFINILALKMASPGNQHCANCIGTFSFPIPITLTVFMPNIKIPAIQSIEANSRKKNKATTATRSKAHFIGSMHVNVYSPL